MRKIIILLIAFLSTFALGWLLCDSAFGEVLLDDGTWKKQTIKIKDLETGETKKIKYRIHGVNRDRIKIYKDGEIKRYKIKK